MLQDSINRTYSCVRPGGAYGTELGQKANRIHLDLSRTRELEYFYSVSLAKPPTVKRKLTRAGYHDHYVSRSCRFHLNEYVH